MNKLIVLLVLLGILAGILVGIEVQDRFIGQILTRIDSIVAIEACTSIIKEKGAIHSMRVVKKNLGVLCKNGDLKTFPR